MAPRRRAKAAGNSAGPASRSRQGHRPRRFQPPRRFPFPSGTASRATAPIRRIARAACARCAAKRLRRPNPGKSGRLRPASRRPVSWCVAFCRRPDFSGCRPRIATAADRRRAKQTCAWIAEGAEYQPGIGRSCLPQGVAAGGEAARTGRVTRSIPILPEAGGLSPALEPIATLIRRLSLDLIIADGHDGSGGRYVCQRPFARRV